MGLILPSRRSILQARKPARGASCGAVPGSAGGRNARSAYRFLDEPGTRIGNYGFRLALGPELRQDERAGQGAGGRDSPSDKELSPLSTGTTAIPSVLLTTLWQS